MVKIISDNKYGCPFCNNKYLKESDAIECIERCIMEIYYQSPEEINIHYYQCDICEEYFEKEESAIICEEVHKKNNDLKFKDYDRKIHMEILIKHGNEKNQKKLIG